MSTTITAEGNLTTDPELRFTKVTGQAVCTCRLAVSSRRKDMDGEYVDTPTVFYEATVWGALAEHVADSLHKGDRVLVHGSTYDEEWTDRDGNTRSKHVIQVNAAPACATPPRRSTVPPSPRPRPSSPSRRRWPDQTAEAPVRALRSRRRLLPLNEARRFFHGHSSIRRQDRGRAR